MQKPRTSLFRLRDNRIMEYVEFGDPHGDPVLHFHSYFGSCTQAAFIHDAAFKEGMRLIACNRPGIGRSSPAEFSTMVGYADDIAQLLDHLHISSAGAVGISGGACFALACGYVLPQVRTVGLAGCIGPMNVLGNLRRLPFMRRTFLTECERSPNRMKKLLRAFFQFCKRHPHFVYQRILRSSSMLEAALYDHEGIQDILWWDYEQLFMQDNGVDALMLEAKLYFHWGFTLDAYPEETRVVVWHGEGDIIFPWSALQPMLRPIRHVRTEVYSGGHVGFLLHEMPSVFRAFKEEAQKTETSFDASATTSALTSLTLT